jgi:ketosteroid isomerase-like protein
MLPDELFAAAEAFDADALDAIIHPDVRFSEMPNRINPDGSERGRDEALAGFARGRELLSGQRYDVLSRVVDGDTIAARVTWHGTLAAGGQELTAHIATFTQVRDGKVFRHATYDCYAPFTTESVG